MKRLAIVVPYRDRQQHLDQFVPHMRAYFARDKLDRAIDYRVMIVEQEPGLPFNRGALKNIGFTLVEPHTDYACFHDIDYLPIWADYSWAEGPTPIVWYGAEERPIAPGRTNRVTRHNLDLFFGGALLVPNNVFRAVNGYSNDYWGWGSEDEDFKLRFAAAGIEAGRRKGTFLPLIHDNEGFNLDASPAPIAIVNPTAAAGSLGTDGVARRGRPRHALVRCARAQDIARSVSGTGRSLGDDQGAAQGSPEP